MLTAMVFHISMNFIPTNTQNTEERDFFGIPRERSALIRLAVCLAAKRTERIHNHQHAFKMIFKYPQSLPLPHHENDKLNWTEKRTRESRFSLLL